MQETRDELTAHALAERELAHGLVDDVRELEARDEIVAALAVLGRRKLVDPREQVEGVRGRQVAPEL